MSTDKTETQVAYELGAAMSAPHIVDKTPFIVVPDDFKVQGLEHYLPTPTRKRGVTTLRDAASFIKLVTQEANEGSRIYGSYQPPKFVAVFNEGAGAEGPGGRTIAPSLTALCRSNGRPGPASTRRP